MPRRLVLAVLVVVCAVVGWAAQPQFWKLEGARDFLDGDLEGLSVDSEGRLRLGPATHLLQDPQVPYIWCLARDAHGVLYAGTGSDGKVFRIEDGHATTLFDAPELEVHAIAVGPDGRVYAATSPEGKIYVLDATGKSSVFFDPSDKYIWALAFAPNGDLFVATGAEGKIYRVDPQGKSHVLFTSPETHMSALALGRDGTLYAGSASGGVLYRIDPSGKAFVLYDAPYREVKAIAIASDGSVYAAVVDGQDKDETTRRPAIPTPSPGASTGGSATEVTVTESFTLFPSATPSPSTGGRSVEPLRGTATKGAVLRVLPTAEVDTLWSSSEDMPHALVVSGNDVLVGTGDKGKLYRVRNDRTWTMVARFAAEQVTALVSETTGFLLATSNPGKIQTLDNLPGGSGVFTSKAKDTETISGWGALRWEAALPAGTRVEVQTRSGNTGTPDTTWSEWSSAHTHAEGQAIQSPRARFLQLRVTLHGDHDQTPVVDSISASYLQRNLRPDVASITVHPPGDVFQKPLSISGEMEILGTDGSPNMETRSSGVQRSMPQPSATSYSRKLFQKGMQTFSWRADDPNGDALSYDVFYRRVDDTRFHPLRRGLSEAVIAWDTTTVPNGRYVLRITASDAPGNPTSVALSADKESAPFDVDNTPPLVTATLAARDPLRIKATARDENSVLRRLEYSLDGGRWQEVHPLDGISDSLEETYEITITELPPPAPHVVVVRATDLLGNVATARVEVP